MQLTIVPDRTHPLCGMPLTLDRTCPRPVDLTGYTGGQMPGYCDDPDHNSQHAYRARKRLEREAAEAAAGQPAPPPRPVTQGITSLAAMVRRLEDVRNEIAGLLASTVEATAAISDPASVAYEIDQVRRDAEAQVAQAEKARAAAEHAAEVAETERDRAIAMRDTATAAADEAISERNAAHDRAERLIHDTKRQIAAEQARLHREIDAAHTAIALAEHQRDAAVQTASARTTEAQQLRVELDQFHAEQARVMRDEISALRKNR